MCILVQASGGFLSRWDQRTQAVPSQFLKGTVFREVLTPDLCGVSRFLGSFRAQ
jgi:hypothetical protein